MAADDPNLKARLEQLTAEVEQTYRPPSDASSGASSTPSEQAPNRPTMMARWKQNALIPIFILVIPWAQEVIDQVFFGGRWNLPIHPRTLEGLPGIIFAAFSHGGFGHLISNTIAFTIFSWLILIKSRRDYWITFCMGWLGGGAVSWLLGPTSVHGLSGVVYALFGSLLVIGWLEKRLVPLALSVFVLANYSYHIWGIFPTHPMVAWWGHLFGLALGILAAFGVYREPKKAST